MSVADIRGWHDRCLSRSRRRGRAIALDPGALADRGRCRQRRQWLVALWSLRPGVHIAIRTAGILELCGGVMPSHHLIQQYDDLFEVEKEIKLDRRALIDVSDIPIATRIRKAAKWRNMPLTEAI